VEAAPAPTRGGASLSVEAGAGAPPSSHSVLPPHALGAVPEALWECGVLSRLDEKALLFSSSVCREWHAACSKPSLWLPHLMDLRRACQLPGWAAVATAPPGHPHHVAGEKMGEVEPWVELLSALLRDTGHQMARAAAGGWPGAMAVDARLAYLLCKHQARRIPRHARDGARDGAAL